MLLVSAADGGYDVETGFDPSAPGPVPDSPELLTPEEWQARAPSPRPRRRWRSALGWPPTLADSRGPGYAEGDPDEAEPRRWQSLDEHSEQVRDQAAALLAVLAPSIPPEAARSAIIAGYLHDLGKAHEIWQDAICALADETRRGPGSRPAARGPSRAVTAALLFADGVAFRHELASLLLIDGPLAALLAESPTPTSPSTWSSRTTASSACRSASATPGCTVRPAPAVLSASGRSATLAGQAANVIRGLRQGATTAVPPMLGQPATTLTVDLDQFQPAATARGRAPCTVCSTATAPSSSPIWKRSSASPTGAPAAAGSSRPPDDRHASLRERLARITVACRANRHTL